MRVGASRTAPDLTITAPLRSALAPAAQPRPASPPRALLSARGSKRVPIPCKSGVPVQCSLTTRAYLLDTYESAVVLALENAERNSVREGLIHLPIGSSMIPLPEGERVNVIISNPAQLPLPQMERENSPFYAGPEGRSMIEAIIKEAPNKLAPSGRLLMTHSSMANLPKSLGLFESVGLQHRVLAKHVIAFRSFIDRKWLDSLGGEAAGLYSVKDNIAYEAFYVLEAQ